MNIEDFKNELTNLKAHKEKVFTQMVEDIKYIKKIYLNVSDIIDVEISEPDAVVYIKYTIQDDDRYGDGIEVFETSIPINYFKNRDKFMKDLKDFNTRTKRQNLEMMISSAEDQLTQYKKELEKLKNE